MWQQSGLSTPRCSHTHSMLSVLLRAEPEELKHHRSHLKSCRHRDVSQPHAVSCCSPQHRTLPTTGCWPHTERSTTGPSLCICNSINSSLPSLALPCPFVCVCVCVCGNPHFPFFFFAMPVTHQSAGNSLAAGDE